MESRCCELGRNSGLLLGGDGVDGRWSTGDCWSWTIGHDGVEPGIDIVQVWGLESEWGYGSDNNDNTRTSTWALSVTVFQVPRISGSSTKKHFLPSHSHL